MQTLLKADETGDLGQKLEGAGALIIRYGLVIILVWVGALKFTAYEAENIKPLITHSPLLSWGYRALGVRRFAGMIGSIEMILGLMIATRRIWPRLSAAGSLGAVGMFLVTLSFVLSTPGVWEPNYGFPFPSAMPGQFLLKDVLLLGAAVWTAGEAITHISKRIDTRD